MTVLTGTVLLTSIATPTRIVPLYPSPGRLYLRHCALSECCCCECVVCDVSVRACCCTTTDRVWEVRETLVLYSCCCDTSPPLPPATLSAYTVTSRRSVATILYTTRRNVLMVRDKVGRLTGELGVSKSMECDIFHSVLWHCWLGDRKGIRPVKKLDVGLLVVMILLELCTTYSSRDPVVTTTSIILCFNKHRLTQVHLENCR